MESVISSRIIKKKKKDSVALIQPSPRICCGGAQEIWGTGSIITGHSVPAQVKEEFGPHCHSKSDPFHVAAEPHQRCHLSPVMFRTLMEKDF